MKSLFRNLILATGALLLGATAATAAPWPPAKGDLILGVQATGGTGSTTNVFFNLGPAHTLRDMPNPGTLLVNLDAELTAAFGSDWASRDDLYFGVIANRNNLSPNAPDNAPAENGDPARTIYASKGTGMANTTTPWAGFSVSALGIAATAHSGFIGAIDNVAANGNNVMTLSQGSNPVEWNNSWTKWNPTPGTAFSIFTGGIQRAFAVMGVSQPKMLDVHRIQGDTGAGTYETTIFLDDSGDLFVGNAFFTLTSAAVTGGTVTGTGSYPTGFTATLTAVPDTGYGFTGWTGSVTSADNPLDVVMDSDKAIAPTFALLPSISDPTATDVTDVSATLGGNATAQGDSAITEKGVVFSIESDNNLPEIGGTSVTQVTAAGGLGTFTVPAMGLIPGKTYAYRAYATSTVGTAYTDVSYFSTESELAFTGNIATVMGQVIQGGDSQTFAFTLSEARTVVIETVGGLAGLSWELRDSFNQVIAFGTGNVDLEEALAAGDYTLVIENTDTAPNTYDLEVDASQEAVARPDVSIGTNAAASVGNNVYAPARVTIIAKKAAPRNGYAKIGNDGALADTMKVFGSRGNGFFKVNYFGPGNITAAVNLGTFTTASLDSGDAPLLVRQNVIPNKKKLSKKKGKKKVTLKKTLTSTIRATASSNPALSDSGLLIYKTQ